MKVSKFLSGSRLPGLVEPNGERNLGRFARANREDIESALLEAGALLFRGFSVSAPQDFDGFVTSISSSKMDYVYGSTPRTLVKDRIYTATEYPSNQEIPLHNEVSYFTEWPQKLALCCITPATVNGQTPLADMRLVNTSIGEALVREFQERKVRYVRHYHPYVDVPWQQVFQTEKVRLEGLIPRQKANVASFCKRHGIQFEWLEDDVLRTVQICQGTTEHPTTGEVFFFNQAHLFHVSSLDPAKAASMIEMFGMDRLPRNSFFGDGSEIPESSLNRIRAAFRDNAVDFDWQAGDVVLVDNLQAAHGRRTFEGPRQILAALMDPTTQQTEAWTEPRKPWWQVW